jgi:hypothetical protein
MFQQKKRVGLLMRFNEQFGLFLDGQGFLVVNSPQPLDQQVSFFHHATRTLSFCVILAAGWMKDGTRKVEQDFGLQMRHGRRL